MRELSIPTEVDTRNASTCWHHLVNDIDLPVVLRLRNGAARPGKYFLQLDQTSCFVFPEFGLISRTQGFECLGWTPGDWLLRCSVDDREMLLELARSQLDRFAVHDISDGVCHFEVIGSAACDFIATGSTIDQQTLRPMTCVTTRFADIRATIISYSRTRYRLIAERSYEDYLKLWFTDAALDVGL